MPYFEFSRAALDFLGAMPVEVFDWGTWLGTDEGKALAAGGAAIDTATPDQLVKLSTALVRADRFTEGTLAWAFESGLLGRIVRRAAALTHGDQLTTDTEAGRPTNPP